jgi:hypothetical protein
LAVKRTHGRAQGWRSERRPLKSCTPLQRTARGHGIGRGRSRVGAATLCAVQWDRRGTSRVQKMVWLLHDSWSGSVDTLKLVLCCKLVCVAPSIVTRLRAGRPGFDYRQEKGLCLSNAYWRGVFPGGKTAGAWSWPPTSM